MMSTPNAIGEMTTFRGDSEMARLMRRFDWSATGLGPAEAWAGSLRFATDICLSSRFPIVLFWGPDLLILYNDGYVPMLGPAKHPAALGQPAVEVWSEIWDVIEPMLRGVMERRESTWSDDQLLLVDRQGVAESYFTFSYSPITADDGEGVAGVFCAVAETTERVIGERRLAVLRDAAAATVDARTVQEAALRVVAALAADRSDLTFATLDLIDEAGAVFARFGDPSVIPQEKIVSVAAGGRVERVAGVSVDVDIPKVGPRTTSSLLLMPIQDAGHQRAAAVLEVGLSPVRAYDDGYSSFLSLLAGQVGTALADARADEAERERAERLAEVDRAKTAFFSNVSHEFRTPVTLMLGPIEDTLALPAEALPAGVRDGLEIVHRNGLRMKKLVNALLDFSRIEAGRIDAAYEPTELATLTSDLASNFRSACERAGISLVVDCQPIGEPVYVDVEMWEKIVLNLLSNAFKFTLDGQIDVTLRRDASAVRLEVRDTGIGIQPEDLDRIFERFRRIEDARGRTYEGTGIGLALVQELVRLHAGEIRVESRPGEGSTFSVAVPLGLGHLPADRIGTRHDLESTSTGARPFVEEALGWLPSDPARSTPTLVSSDGSDASEDMASGDIARVLVVDDNADMRAYLESVLSPHWTVEVAADGGEALAAIERRPPDLIVSDVMMPTIDGIELLHRLRSDDRTRLIPVILLSARAGEESQVAGLQEGADDYLVKPFSARELRGRVGARLEIARMSRERRRAMEREREELYRIFEQAPMPIVVMRGRRLVIDMVNKVALDLVGWCDPIGKPIGDVFPDLRGQGLEPLLLGVLETGRPYVGNEVPVRMRVDRPTNYFSFVFAPMRNEAGDVDGVISMAMDVTQQVLDRGVMERALEREREANSALRRSEAELAAAGSAKDEFLGLVSHELKTPISIIYGDAAILETRSDGLDPAVRDSLIVDIRAESERLQSLIDDLLVLARGQQSEVEREPVIVRRLVDQVVQRERRASGRLIELEDAETDVTVEALPGYLEQVLRNLLSNALKYSQPGSPVTIGIEPDSDTVAVEVRDRGIGFADDEIEQLFTPFYRSDRAAAVTSGVGIGLVVCKRVIEAHGGRIWARQRKRGGAAVGFELPRATVPQEP